jgi:hypothetical protein
VLLVTGETRLSIACEQESGSDILEKVSNEVGRLRVW